MDSSNRNEIVLYQPDETLKIDVRVENENVWLNRNQIAKLFDRDVKTIGKHINNAIKEELEGLPVIANFATTAADGKTYKVDYYNIEMITSVGYRVKSKRGIQFRQWANQILKDYLLKGYAVNHRISIIEDKLDRKFAQHDRQLSQLEEKINFFVRTSLPPKEGIFFNGQIFDAYALIAELIRKAHNRIAIIDNYIDESILVQLSKRSTGIPVDIYDGQISRQLRQDVDRHNIQYPGVTLHNYTKAHDRFLIIDEEVYHIGASLKDLGKKLFAFSKMDVMTGSELLSKIKGQE